MVYWAVGQILPHPFSIFAVFYFFTFPPFHCALNSCLLQKFADAFLSCVRAFATHPFYLSFTPIGHTLWLQRACVYIHHCSFAHHFLLHIIVVDLLLFSFVFMFAFRSIEHVFAILGMLYYLTSSSHLHTTSSSSPIINIIFATH